MRDNQSEIFLDSVAELIEQPLSDNLQHQAKRCLLDYIGVAIIGADMLRKESQTYANICEDGGGNATWIGFSEKVSLLNAAFLNGMAAHAAELDDGVRFGMIHVGTVIFPALLAAAEKRKSNGDELLRAIVAGYESSVGLAYSMQPDHYSLGFHPTATCGSVGAAIGVGVLSGFSRRQLLDALSAISVSASGSLKIIENNSGLKPANAGRAALSGLLAAFQAEAGFVGVEDPLGGQNGFLSMMAGHQKLNCDRHLPSKAWIEQVYVKPYAACRHAHPAIEAGLRLRKLAGVQHGHVEKVEITTYESVIGKHDHCRIEGPASARMSIPYGFSVAYVTGGAGIAQFEHPYVSDSDILDLTNKVMVRGEGRLTALVPSQRVAEVNVYLTDGRCLNERVDYPLGEPENPLSDHDLEVKFTELTNLAGLNTTDSQRIIDTVWELPRSLDKLYPLLSKE